MRSLRFIQVASVFVVACGVLAQPRHASGALKPPPPNSVFVGADFPFWDDDDAFDALVDGVNGCDGLRYDFGEDKYYPLCFGCVYWKPHYNTGGGGSWEWRDYGTYPQDLMVLKDTSAPCDGGCCYSPTENNEDCSDAYGGGAEMNCPGEIPTPA